MPSQQTTLTGLPFDQAVETIRDNYDDTYAARVSFGGDFGKFATRNELELPRCAASEAVLQPLLRYQQLSPEDVRNTIERKVDDEDDVSNILTALRQFAAEL